MMPSASFNLSKISRKLSLRWTQFSCPPQAQQALQGLNDLTGKLNHLGFDTLFV